MCPNFIKIFAMNQPRYKNLLFDLGGVIIDLRREACVCAFERLGMTDAEEQFGQYSQQGAFLAFEEGQLSVDEFHAEVRALLPLGVTDEQIDAAFCEFLVGIPVHRLRALACLHERYNMYMLSNTNPIHMEKCVKGEFCKDSHDINYYFDSLVLSYEAKAAKPSEFIFRYVEDTLGIKPEETLFIDDSQKNLDVASRLGFGVVLVRPGEEFADVLKAFAIV